MKTSFVILLFATALLLGSCTTTRKCNGTPGTRVPMGVM